MFEHSNTLSPINDFVGKIEYFDEENAIIETDLFDIDSLRYYAKKLWFRSNRKRKRII